MITVLAFASYRELLGFERIDLPMSDPPSLEALLARKEFQRLPKNALLAINQRFSERSAILSDGDEVALLPPVSGG